MSCSSAASRSALFGGLCAGLAALASACGQLPQPYLHSGFSTNPLVQPEARGGVVIEPVAGAPNGAELALAVAEALQRRGVAVNTGPAVAGRAMLSGDVTPEPVGPGTVRLRFGWHVPSEEGDGVSYTHSLLASQEAWRRMSLALTHRIAEAAARGLAPLINGTPEMPPSTPTIAVIAVSGAPGDGGIALRRAIAFELGKAGYATVETAPKEPGALTLRGKVTMGHPRAGLQAITIAWTMRGADGKVIGTARQASRVPAGSLDGAWGTTAISVAQAAVPAILSMAKKGGAAPTGAKR